MTLPDDDRRCGPITRSVEQAQDALIVAFPQKARGVPRTTDDAVHTRRDDPRTPNLETPQPPVGLAAHPQATTDADLAALQALLDAYRVKRSVDGRGGRPWEGALHADAEDRIVALEAVLEGKAQP